MAVEVPNKALNTCIFMMGNHRGIHFASPHTQLHDSLQEQCSINCRDLINSLMTEGGGGGGCHPLTDFSSFSSSLGNLSIKKFFRSDQPSWL